MRTATVILLATLLAGISRLSLAQDSRTQAPGHDIEQEAPKDPEKIEMEKKMARKANQERQAELQRDTDKLVKLTADLKQYVDKSSENTLSLDVIKKAEEIERLAHSVKEKMKGN